MSYVSPIHWDVSLCGTTRWIAGLSGMIKVATMIRHSGLVWPDYIKTSVKLKSMYTSSILQSIQNLIYCRTCDGVQNKEKRIWHLEIDLLHPSAWATFVACLVVLIQWGSKIVRDLQEVYKLPCDPFPPQILVYKWDVHDILPTYHQQLLQQWLVVPCVKEFDTEWILSTNGSHRLFLLSTILYWKINVLKI